MTDHRQFLPEGHPDRLAYEAKQSHVAPIGGNHGATRAHTPHGGNNMQNTQMRTGISGRNAFIGLMAIVGILFALAFFAWFRGFDGMNDEDLQQTLASASASAQEDEQTATATATEMPSPTATEVDEETDEDFRQQMESDLEELRSKVDDLLNESTNFRAAIMFAQDKLDIKSDCEDKDWDCMLKEIMAAYTADPDPKLERQINTLIAERQKVQDELEKLRAQIQDNQQTSIQTSGDTSSEWMVVSPNLTTWFGTKVYRGGPNNDFYVEFVNPLNKKTIRIYREDGWRVMVDTKTGKVLNIDDKCVKRGQLAHNNGPFADAGCEDRDSHDPTDPNPGDGRTIEWHAALDCESMNALNTVWVEGINEAHVRIEQEGYNDIKLAVTGPYWANWTEVKTDKVIFTFYGTWQDGSRFEFREIRYCYRQPTQEPTDQPTATKVVPPTATNGIPPTATKVVHPTATNGIPPTATKVVPPTATNGIPPTATKVVPPTATSQPSPTNDPTATGQPTTTKVPPTATATATKEPTPKPTVPSYCTEPINYLQAARHTADRFGTLVREHGHHRLFGLPDMIYRESIFDECQTLIVDAEKVEDLAPGGKVLNFAGGAPLDKGCVIAFRQGSPSGALDIHLKITDGQASHVTVETGISTSDAIAVVRDKLMSMLDRNGKNICHWDNGDGVYQDREIVIYQMGAHGPY